MQKLFLTTLILILAASAAFLSSTAQAQTYKAISLDGGGHTSGFAQSKANTVTV